MRKNQTTRTPRTLPLPPGQRQPQPAQPDVAQHPQQSHFQVPPVPAYNSQWTVSRPSRPPLALDPDTNHDYSPQQQHQYYVPPPVAQPLPQLVAQPNYNSYQPTAGYPRHYVPQPVASPHPQLAYYPHPQPRQQQQQQRWYYILLPCLTARHQRFDSPNLAQRLAPPPYSQFPPPPPPAQNTGVYPGQSQVSGHGDGDGWPNSIQPSANKGGQVGNREWRDGARGGSMSGNRGETADRGRVGNYMDSGGGGRRAGQSGGGVGVHWSEENFSGAASIQAEGRNTIPTSAEPAAIPVATQLQGAHNVNMSGNPTLMNIGTNTGNLTTVNNYGGIHGLEKLERFVSFAALHDSAEQDPDRRCHPGTRETVLGQLRGWFHNSNATNPIIWLHGPAGVGKSAIAQTIADEYKKRGDFIVHALNETPHLPTKRAETQFEELVAHPFHAMNHIATQMLHPAPVVIIDGVDECFDELLQRRFLTVIGDAAKDTRIPLRFIIVSRPEALIEETLNKFKDFTVSIDLAKLDDSNRDIQKYLEDKFSEIVSSRDLDPTWPGQGTIEEIVSRSSGSFIFASLVIRFLSDEDCDPQFLLNIVLNLAPRGNMTPFALLDELYLEILKRQRDQDFLKTFLALLLGRSSIKQDDLHKDDAILMNISEKDLHIRLRRMRSLLKFEPFIDVHHKSFLDFLQDPSRSGQYYVSKEGGQKRYLELIVDSVVRHVFEQPNRHGTCRSSPVFKSIVTYPPMIVLPVEDWQEALKPLQDKLLKTPKLQSCRVTQVMRELLLHLVILQGKLHPITVVQAREPNMNETEAQRNIPVKDLGSCLSVLLSCLQKMDSVMVVDRATTDHMFSLLAFDYAETAARVRSVPDAQKLIDLIDLLTNNESFLSQCSRRDAGCNAARLASEIFARVPLLPQSLVLNKPGRYIQGHISSSFELACQTAFISRILDHNHIVPVLGIYDEGNRLRLVSGNENEQDESVREWLKRSNPNLVTRIRVILEVARTIRYIHSMDVALLSDRIQSEYFFLNSNLRAKFEFIGLFTWWVREASIYGHESSRILAVCTYESNTSAFGLLFHEVCFGGRNETPSNPLAQDARQLIERCRANDPESQPIMEDIVKEMETWNLT
ncbi:hypothetical protein JOM56_004847 [Amanita muscaria]